MNQVQAIKLVVKQTEIESGITQTIFSGRAMRIRNAEMESLSYTEPGSGEVTLEIKLESLLLTRVGEATTTLKFSKDKVEHGNLTTNYGVISLEILTDELEITSSYLRWRYRLHQSGQVVGAYVSEWTMEETE